MSPEPVGGSLPNRPCVPFQDTLTGRPLCPGPCARGFLTSNPTHCSQETTGGSNIPARHFRGDTSTSAWHAKPTCSKPAATHCSPHASELTAWVEAAIMGRGLPEPTSGSLSKPSLISPKWKRDDHVKKKEAARGRSPYSKASYGALPLGSVLSTHRGQRA